VQTLSRRKIVDLFCLLLLAASCQFQRKNKTPDAKAPGVGGVVSVND